MTWSQPRISVGGLMGLVGLIALALGFATQSPPDLGDLLTLALIVLPALAICWRFGSDRLSDRTRTAVRVNVIRLLRVAMSLTILGAILLVVAANVGVLGYATLRPFDTITLVVVAVTVLALFACGHLALLGRGTRQAFGWGAFVAGWPFLVLGLAPAASDRMPVLVTGEILHQLYPYLYGASDLYRRPLAPTLYEDPNKRWGRPYKYPVYPDYLRLQRVGHCLFAVAFAALGGLAAGWLVAVPTGARQSRPVENPRSDLTHLPWTA